MEFRPYPQHERWEDVSGETEHEFNHHWHHVDSEQGSISIRAVDESIENLAGVRDGWTVEIHPYPKTGNMARWHFSPDDVEESPPAVYAMNKVEELMEEWAEA
jgi:hypothetical protein